VTETTQPPTDAAIERLAFDEALAELQRTVAQLEAGGQPLEESLALYERGVALQQRCDRLLVHFDVDVIDFTDVPLSENWGRNEGLAYDHAIEALEALLASPKLIGMTITELNPDHTEEGAESIERFVADVCRGLSGAPAIENGLV